MVMKGTIQLDHMPANKYLLYITNMPIITFTSVSGLDEKLETVDLPDRTKASGGNSKPIELTAKVPMHHRADNVALEAWYGQGRDPVLPSYKVVGTMNYISLSSIVIASYSLVGIFCTGRKTPDVEMKNEGDMVEVEWGFSVDVILPIL